MKINLIINFFIFSFLYSCNKPNFELTSRFNNHTTIVYLLKDNIKTDSLTINSYYGKDSIVNLKNNIWNFIYSERCGSGCSIKKQVILSIVNHKLKKNLHIETYYKEGVLGDTTFEKSFIRKTDILKNKKKFYLKRTCIKNDEEYYTITQKLTYDQNKQIYYNKMFSYNNKKYNGVKIDSSEYIYYKNKWYDYDNKEKKIYNEL